MWFATWNGINRFDGRHFVSFKSSPGDQSFLKNNRIDQIIEDDYRHLWLKSYDGQIYRFDKQTEQFMPLSTILRSPQYQNVYYTSIFSIDHENMWVGTENDGLLLVMNINADSSSYINYNANEVTSFKLPSNKISLFKKLKNGTVWVGTPQGLACLVKDKDGVYKRRDYALLKNVVDVKCVEERNDQLYFGTASGDVIIYNSITDNLSSFNTGTAKINSLLVDHTSDHLYATTAAGELLSINISTHQSEKFVYPDHTELSTIFQDKNNNLWIKPAREGVVKFSPNDHRFKTYTQKTNAKKIYPGDHYAIFEDSKGTVWINLLGGGFGYYNAAKDVVDYFFNEPNSPNRKFSNMVAAVYYDPSGILWMRTDERGIEKITFQQNDFNQQLLMDPGVFLSDNEVRGLLQDRKGRLWVDSKSNHLYVFENGKEQHLKFQNMPQNGMGLIYTMMQDNAGAIWLGTKSNGLYKAVPVNREETSYKLYHFTFDPSGANGINGKEIYTLLQDKKGRIWIGTFDNGLTVVRCSNDPSQLVRDNISDGYSKTRFRKIRHMALDKTGNVWIGTTDGLLIANTKDADKLTYTAYQKKPGDITGLSNNNVQFITKDSKDRMWIATANGLNMAIGDHPEKELRFAVYSEENGLPNDYLLSCVEDKQGNLWIATQAGLAKLNPDGKTFRNYNSFDGLPKYAFSEASAIRMSDGKLAFGTLRGYLDFDPQAIVDHPIQAAIAFTNVQINNKDVSPTAKGSPMTLAANYTQALTLKHDQNIISIDYTVPDFRWNSKASYAYRLKGFDDEWHYNRFENRATYTNLPPGKYVFEVKSVNNELYSNVPAKSMSITILPPPWKTWWAYAIYGALASLAFLLIRRTVLTMLRLRQNIALEKKLSDIKLNFFTNVSHELRTPLTLIINPVEEVVKQEQLSPRGRQYMEVVRKNAGRMSRFVDQLLTLRKLEGGKMKLFISNIDVGLFVKGVCAYFDEMVKEKHIDFRIINELPNAEVWMDAGKIETVVYNLLGNAFKFTANNKSIHVTIKKGATDNNIVLEVADQGTGVPANKLAHIFKLFYEYEGADVQNTKGIGIGLALCKQLVELHGGSIAAENNTKGGLTVKVTLPAGAQHFDKEIVQFIDNEMQQPVETNMESNPQPLVSSEQADEQDKSTLILLVEDNADLRFFLKDQLAAHYRIETARNGVEGLQKASELMPDLVLSDIMMPEMDGLEMLSRLKNDNQTSHIPVILLTAKSAVESQIEGLEFGADYYIAKPFSLDLLFAAIQNIIKKQKRILNTLLDNKKIIHLVSEEIQVLPQDEIFLQKVVDTIEEKMTNPDFDIDTVAETLAVSRSSFYKKFKGLTGIAPVEFVREMRLKKAEQYLRSGYNNISEVAYLVGFNDPKYFSTCFKAKYQMTPKKFIQECQQTMQKD
ncbi:hybrid sensor histidine kinase/response regulator transcription factor [Pinibacter soli]|uniref:histidine kinase n=1 Tax=Pinibacter soli TaxID=3044211 RepID=A0ABT6REE7_9BACT|nr:hybrid sensor histidine kinase/response regulator transcription factor [Pinibacter soli]MDI3320905.1 two-component regulator propeller domain-containing protein [Pinibacter soli]